MRRTTALLTLALALGTGACDDDGDKPTVTTGTGGMTAPDGGAGGAGGAPGSDGAAGSAPLVLTEWVHDLVTKHTNQTSDPDTVDDKEGRLQISEDPEAFTPILDQP